MRLRNRIIEDPSPINSIQTRNRRKLVQEENHFSLDENQSELNTYVLGHIFSFLDLGSIKNCRLVSKTWNEEASLQLGHKSWFKNNLYKKFKLTIGQKKEDGKDETDYLFECLSNMFNPCLFENFEFDLEWLMKKNFQKLLAKFGSTLKRVTISSEKLFIFNEFDADYSKRMKIVCEILWKLCPKVSTFQMKVDRQTNVRFLPMQIKWMKPNNVRELRLSGWLTEFQSDFWIELIKRSPCLSKLSISCIPTISDWCGSPENIEICESFFQQLSKLPEVTKKLEDFSWNAAWPEWENDDSYSHNEETCNIFKAVSDMEFSSKLRKIEFGTSQDGFNGKELDFTRILKKLNAYGTEQIVFSGRYFKPVKRSGTKNDENERDVCKCDDEHKLECLCKINHIQEMPKVTSIKSIAEDNYELGASSFVRKFPNLKTLDMSPYLRYDRVDNIASEWGYLCKFPHYNLRTLILNPSVNKPKILECIVESFPNLTSLQFDVGDNYYLSARIYGPFRPPHPNEVSFKDALSIVSKCEHLKNLTVSFFPKYLAKDLCEALAVVKDFPELEFLTVNGVNDYAPVPVKSILRGLLELSNLTTSVSFIGYEMTSYEETVQMKKYCEENRIRAKFIPDKRNKTRLGCY